MLNSNRREFVKKLVIAATAFGNPLPINFKEHRHKLAFSTLACPKWTYKEIVNNASKFGYQGIEIRGILGKLDLPTCPVFESTKKIKIARAMAKDKGLAIVGLGASAQMHHEDPKIRLKNLDEAKKFIELAAQLDCPMVRVFPDSLPKTQDRAKTIDLIISGLDELGNFAKKDNVNIWMDTHGDVVYISDLTKIFQSVHSSSVAMIWDVFNMWSVTQQQPQAVYAALSPYIRHIHVKDALWSAGAFKYVAIGEGQTTIVKALQILKDNKFNGFYSFEWEKHWHPELTDAEIALPEYVHFMNDFLKG